MDTRTQIHYMVGYENFYPEADRTPDPSKLIAGIPSEVMLKLIADINLALYGNDHNRDTFLIQASAMNAFIVFAEQYLKSKIHEFISECSRNQIAPIFYSTYSNLLFYDLVFRNFKYEVPRIITPEQLVGFFDAYLVINSTIGDKLRKITEEEVKVAQQNNAVEELVLPFFINQMDYRSSVDLIAQAIRGVLLFKYVEFDQKYKFHMNDFYSQKHVTSYKVIFRAVLSVLTKMNTDKCFVNRDSLIDLRQFGPEVDRRYIESLCINSVIPGYKGDDDFSEIRSHPFYKYDQDHIILMNLNFLIDQLYKTQIFSLNSFFKAKGLPNFLTDKASEFIEGAYLQLRLNNCFPRHVKFHTNACINSKAEELCDFYLRLGNRICLIELKDILLSSRVKNKASKEELLGELKKKLVENEKGSPKGITQLTNAIKDITAYGVRFDKDLPDGGIEIYPVILYTDNTFAMDGINMAIVKIQAEKMSGIDAGRFHVKDVVLANLTLFEIYEKYFSEKTVDFFEMLSAYLSHVKNPAFQGNSFEVFARLYIHETTSGESFNIPDIFTAIVVDQFKD